MRVEPEEKITSLQVAEKGVSTRIYVIAILFITTLIGFGFWYRCELALGECKVSIDGAEFTVRSTELEPFQRAKSQPCNLQAQLAFYRLLDHRKSPLSVASYIGAVATKRECAFSDFERSALSLEAYRLASTAGDVRLAESYLNFSIKTDPTQAQAYLELGDLLLRQANYGRAAEAYRLATYHVGGMGKVGPNGLWDFAQSLIGSGSKCEAVEVLRYLKQLTDGQPRVIVLLEKLNSQRVCGIQRTSELVLREVNRRVLVPVIVNGQAFDFLFDTGATSTVLSAKTAELVGVHRGDGWQIVETAGGYVSAYPAELDSVVLGEDSWKKVHVLVIDDLSDDGILGMEFISRYDINKKDGVWTLSSSQ